MKTHAYIDGTNLHKGIEMLGWKLDYKKFRTLLKDRYGVEKAYYFIGAVENNEQLYKNLKQWGYELALKSTVPYGKGEIKGNCDVQLTLKIVQDFYEKAFDKTILVTGDGDFVDLAIFLTRNEVLKTLIIPSHRHASHLLEKHQYESNKRIYTITSLESMQEKLEYQSHPK